MIKTQSHKQTNTQGENIIISLTRVIITAQPFVVSILALCEGNSSMSGGFPSQILQWRHNGRDSVSNHQPRECLLNRLTRCRSKKKKKTPRHWPLCGEFTGDRGIPGTKASNAENVSIWWRHHEASDTEHFLISNDISDTGIECLLPWYWFSCRCSTLTYRF